MKALVVGTGGVGQSIAAIAKRRDPKGEWLQQMIMADYDGKRAADFVATLRIRASSPSRSTPAMSTPWPRSPRSTTPTSS